MFAKIAVEGAAEAAEAAESAEAGWSTSISFSVSLHVLSSSLSEEERV
jgi:hypothetical protein